MPWKRHSKLVGVGLVYMIFGAIVGVQFCWASYYPKANPVPEDSCTRPGCDSQNVTVSIETKHRRRPTQLASLPKKAVLSHLILLPSTSITTASSALEKQNS